MIKKWIKRNQDYLLISSLARLLQAKQPKVLMYHRFSESHQPRCVQRASFEAQVKWLKKHYTVWSLKQVINCVTSSKPLPEHLVVITIDDGYRDFYDIAFPILKAYEVPATLFLTTDFIDQTAWLWPDKIRHIVLTSSQTQMHFHFKDFSLNCFTLEESQKEAACQALGKYCLLLSEQERTEFIEALQNHCQIQLDAQPPEAYRAMTWQHIKEIHENNIEIGSHTCTHMNLTSNSVKLVNEEIIRSKRHIESMIHTPVISFCYPNGHINDYNQVVINQVKNAGYLCACVAFNFGKHMTDLYQINRFSMNNDLTDFKWQISGSALINQKMQSFLGY